MIGNQFAYKNGRRRKTGYIYILNPNHPNSDNMGYVLEHRLVMEKHLGRYLTKKEVIHHLDFNRANNKLNNLSLFENKRLHTLYHWFLVSCVKEMLIWE